jgi:iron(III) transport system ATP-binding protein
MTVITTVGLTKGFGQTVAVDRVDLTIPAGELFFLIGPSGCGKTTLLRLVAGFIEPTAGRIHFDDQDITDLSPQKRRTGMVFQSYAIWPHMSVFENVAYGLRVRKVTAAERSRRVTAALESVRMEQLAERRPNDLSGGEQQRVALARALVVEPRVLLLDEPLSNLDAKLRLEMRLEIKRICRQTRITTVYVTHDQKEALSMADRMAVLHHGRIMQIGTPRSLYNRPRCRFVADFLGETNFLTATVVKTHGPGGPTTLSTAAGELITAAGAAPPAGGGPVTCSIRPEAVRVVNNAAGPPAPNAMSGRLVQTIYLGDMAQHHVEVAEGTLLKVLHLNPSRPPQTGEHIDLTVDPEDVVVLTD